MSSVCVTFLCPAQTRPYLVEYVENLTLALRTYHNTKEVRSASTAILSSGENPTNNKHKNLDIRVQWLSEDEQEGKDRDAPVGVVRVAVQKPRPGAHLWLNTEQMTRQWWVSQVVAWEKEDQTAGRQRWDYSACNAKLWSAVVRRDILKLHLISTTTLAQHRQSHVTSCLPYLLSAQVDDWGQELCTLPKLYDVAFVGTLTPRRQKALDGLRHQRPDLRVLVLTDAFGQARNALLARARVLLNIHADNEYLVFEEIRCAPAIYNGLCVVSETSLFDPQHPLFPHIQFAPYESLVDTVGRVLVSQADGPGVLRVELEAQLLRYSQLPQFYNQLLRTCGTTGQVTCMF